MFEARLDVERWSARSDWDPHAPVFLFFQDDDGEAPTIAVERFAAGNAFFQKPDEYVARQARFGPVKTIGHAMVLGQSRPLIETRTEAANDYFSGEPERRWMQVDRFVILPDKNGFWVLKLSAASDRIDGARKDFESFLASFRVLSKAPRR